MKGINAQFVVNICLNIVTAWIFAMYATGVTMLYKKIRLITWAGANRMSLNEARKAYREGRQVR